MSPASAASSTSSAASGSSPARAVFALIGYFLIRTAIDYDPSKAIGIDGALREVARQPYGSWLLGFVGLGL